MEIYQHIAKNIVLKVKSTTLVILNVMFHLDCSIFSSL